MVTELFVWVVSVCFNGDLVFRDWRDFVHVDGYVLLW